MYTDTEGIILKQVKTVGGRRMILLFSSKYGKISAGTSITEKGRSKTALALRPFTYGKYELYKNRDSFNINGAEVLKSFYKIGEDVDKYMCASYVLEFTEKITVEGQRAPALLNLLIDFLQAIEARTSKYETLVIAYQVKSMKCTGTFPQLNECVICGKKDSVGGFSIKDGGIICESCANNMVNDSKDSLIYQADFGIVKVLKYFTDNPLSSLERIALEENLQKKLQSIIRDYAAYHLDVGNLKSEGFLTL